MRNFQKFLGYKMQLHASLSKFQISFAALKSNAFSLLTSPSRKECEN